MDRARGLGAIAVALMMAFGQVGPVAAQPQKQSEKRVALVIGNGAYRFTPVLPNPPNDARDMGEVLKRLGFADVTLVLDATKTEMERAIRSFGRSLDGSNAAVVFYAGHAMQVNGRNLLLPIDAEIKREQDLNYEVVDLGLILSEVDQGKRTNIVILDACRDNPLAEALTRSMRATGRSTASIGRGLGRIDGAVGTLIAYSTKDGTVASDGTGRNSPYTKALLRHIETPGLPVEAMFKRVREAVLAETGNQQTPWEYGSLIGEFHFNLTVNVAPVVGSTGPADREALFWSSAQSSNRLEEYEEYLKQFPQGMFAGLARTRIVALGVTATAPTIAPSETQTAQTQKPSPQQAMASPSPNPSTIAPSLPLSTAGRGFRDCPDCPEMIVLHSGSFDMGSHDGGADENPVHRVTLSRSFSIAKYEVSFAEWDSCASAGGCRYKPNDQGWGRERQPVVDVSWIDAKEYVDWLSKKTKKAYRLPTEAEWEYAAKEGGSVDLGGRAIRDTGEANCGGCRSHWSGIKTAPVGSFPANQHGLHDLLGNVWEWTEDCWNDSYAGAPTNGSAWVRKNCTERVLRGGAYDAGSGMTRSAFRYKGPPTWRNKAVGFRIARTN